MQLSRSIVHNFIIQLLKFQHFARYSILLFFQRILFFQVIKSISMLGQKNTRKQIPWDLHSLGTAISLHKDIYELCEIYIFHIIDNISFFVSIINRKLIDQNTVFYKPLKYLFLYFVFFKNIKITVMGKSFFGTYIPYWLIINKIPPPQFLFMACL